MAIGIGHSKCLLLGGYAVLDRENVGVCISLKPRIACTAALIPGRPFAVCVHTLPRDKRYAFTPPDWEGPLPTDFGSLYERFILASLRVYFAVNPAPQSAIALSIAADREFYAGHSKTGLGSSAAAVVSIVRSLAALLRPDADSDSDRIFKIAAIAHSVAQGNAGSAFDISCAVWGSQVFRRPSPEFLAISRINEKWDNEHCPVRLPPGLRMYALDTGLRGSSTPDLVRRFYGKAGEDRELFEVLKGKITVAKERLFEGDVDAIAVAFQDLRTALQEISVKWGIEIVPAEVQALAERIEKIEGIIAVVIPGAGGCDSTAVLAKRDFTALENLGLTVLAETE
jgi:phosphomevalonate kinase